MKDVVVVISDLDTNDEGQKHPYTIVHRFDYEGSVEDLVKHISELQGIAHEEHLIAEE